MAYIKNYSLEKIDSLYKNSLIKLDENIKNKNHQLIKYYSAKAVFYKKLYERKLKEKL